MSPPKIKPKLTISSIEKMFLDMRITFSEHPFLTLGCIAGIAFGVTSWFRGRLRRTRGGHFRVGDDHHPHRHGSGSLGIKEFKESLLGGGVAANGKVD